ncbi:MAG: DUF4440 domain-containing protein [Terriglobia bacterium]
MRIRLVVLALLAMLAGGVVVPGAAPAEEEELLALTRALLEHIYVTPDAEFYAAHVAAEVTAYEGPPTRVDGLDFHLFALRQLARQLAEARVQGEERYLDLLNPRVQLYGDAAIVTATSRVTVIGGDNPRMDLLNETRVWARRAGGWKLVHFHKSPVVWPQEN